MTDNRIELPIYAGQIKGSVKEQPALYNHGLYVDILWLYFVEAGYLWKVVSEHESPSQVFILTRPAPKLRVSK